MIVFVFGQLPNNGVSSSAQGGYPVPDIPVSPTSLPAQSGYPGPEIPASPAASLEAIPSWKATEIAIAQWLATYSPQKATWVAEGEATHAAESTAFSQLPPIDKYSTSTPDFSPTLPPLTFLQRAAGAGRIIEGMSPQDFQKSFFSRNTWIEKKADKYILVWAGYRGNYLPEQIAQGEVIVQWLSLSTHQLLPGGGLFLTPEKVGAVVIVDAIGEELMLRAADGTTFYFNVASQAYVSRPLPAQHQLGEGVVIENGDVPFSQPGFRFWNQWARQNGDQRLTVFAGAEGGNKGEWGVGQGVLAIVNSTGRPTADDKPTLYYPPEAYGPLSVFEVVDDQLILVDGWGSPFVFDLNTQRFLSRSEMKLPLAPLFDEVASSPNSS